MKCDECGRDKIEAIGEWVCPWHGYVARKSNAVTFETLAVGERFYSAHARPGEARLCVKVDDRWIHGNARFVDEEKATIGHGPASMVVREGDVEAHFWSLPVYQKDAGIQEPSQSRVLGEPATSKQIQYLIALNVWHDTTITKRRASELIDTVKQYNLVDKTLYAVKPIRAICHLCGRTAPVEEMAEGSGYDWDNPDENLQGSISFLRYTCSDKNTCHQHRRGFAEAKRMIDEINEAGRYDDNSPGKIGG